MGEDLKTCPFCGGEAAAMNVNCLVFIQCTKCAARTGHADLRDYDHDTLRMAVDRVTYWWNKRWPE